MPLLDYSQGSQSEAIILGEVIGYRRWSLKYRRGQGLMLGSIVMDGFVWKPGVNEAQPLVLGLSSLGLPALAFEVAAHYGYKPNGFYAFKRRRQAIELSWMVLQASFWYLLAAVTFTFHTAQDSATYFLAFVEVFMAFVGNLFLSSRVTGQCRMWGEICVHEKGYRAEFAEVCHIDWGFNPFNWLTVALLRRKYLGGIFGHRNPEGTVAGCPDQAAGSGA